MLLEILAASGKLERLALPAPSPNVRIDAGEKYPPRRVG